MGLAVVNRRTCLPHSLRGECLLCRAECEAAGYGAIEALRVGVETDQAGQPVEGSGFMAPVVLEDRCVGCGLCQARCRKANVLESGLLSGPAITVAAGAGWEDRLADGSYVELRRQREQAGRASQPKGGSYLPEFLK
jgi:NAD-dependent dihydropyrimidine dehydrogenase PreA subunit